MEITTFTTDELDRVYELFVDSAPPYCTPRVFHEKIFADDGIAPELRLVAHSDNEIVGFCVGALRPQHLRGHIKLIAVDPAHRRIGIGSALLCAVEQVLAANTVSAIRVAEAAPNYLTPGIPQTNTAARDFFIAHGYDVTGEALNMSADLQREFEATRAEEALREKNIIVRRASATDEVSINTLLSVHWNAWKNEVQNALQNDPVSLHIAIRDNCVLGFSAYDANNVGTGWFGPMGTDPAEAGQGIGHVLLLRCLNDLKSQGIKSATIPWVAPVEFYRRHCNAKISEEFWRMEKRL